MDPRSFTSLFRGQKYSKQEKSWHCDPDHHHAVSAVSHSQDDPDNDDEEDDDDEGAAVHLHSATPEENTPYSNSNFRITGQRHS